MPGCDCECANCTICEDNFDRDDSTDIDTGSECGWTTVSGTPDIFSHALRFTATGLVTCDSSNPGGAFVIVQSDIRHNTNESSCDLVFGYTDSNNYHYVRFTFNPGSTGSIAIRSVVAGSHATIATADSQLLKDTWYVAKVCYSHSGVVSVYQDAALKNNYYVSGITGSKCGLGCTGAGTALFDDFVFEKSYTPSASECTKCTQPCTACTTSSVTDVVAVTLHGVTDQLCTDCELSDEVTYILSRGVGASGTCQNVGCCYLWNPVNSSIPVDPSPQCGSGQNRLFIEVTLSSNKIRVFLWMVAIGGRRETIFDITPGTDPFDCQDTYTSADPPSFGVNGQIFCNVSSVTVEVP